MNAATRPLRADAARNRERILDAAYRAFADEGLAVSLDEIARRACVGPGTVHRHFPAKDDLVGAVIDHRLRQLTAEGRATLAAGPPEVAVFDYIRAIVLRWGPTDHGLTQAMAGIGVDVATAVPHAEADFIDVLGQMLHDAQAAGAVRADVDVVQLKALITGCQAIQGYRPDIAAGVIDIALDGLRPGFTSR